MTFNNEVLIAIGIFVLSYLLVLRKLGLSVYVLLILSVLLHKEMFSLYRWDLLPIRLFVVAFLAASITRGYYWLVKNKDFSVLKKILFSPFIISLIIFWFVSGISIYFSLNLSASLLLYGFLTSAILVSIVLHFVLSGKTERVLKYLEFYIYILFVLSVFGYFQYFLYARTGIIIGAFWNIPNNIARVGATFWDVNHYAALISLLLPVLGIFILTEKKLSRKSIYSIMFISIFATLFLTNSRTGWILAFVAFIVFLGILFFRKFRYKGLLVLVAMLVLLAVPITIEYQNKASPFRAKVKQYFHYRLDSFVSHFMLLEGAGEIFAKHPIFGGGYGSFYEHFGKTKIAPRFFGNDPASLNERTPAHTIWGAVIAETGTLGLSSFVLLIFIVATPMFYVALRGKNKQEYLMCSAMSGAFIGLMVAGIFYSYNSEFFWIVITFFVTYSVSVLERETSLKSVFLKVLTSGKFVFLSLLILCCLLIFSGLGKTHLIPWDEAIYAKIAKNMVQKGEFITQYYNPVVPWYEKPPLYMWAMAGLMKIFGFSSYAARFPSALAGLGTVVLVYLLGKKLFNKTAAFISALVLVTNVYFLYYARSSMLDVTATFFITLSLWLYTLAKDKKSVVLWTLSGVAVGLASMTKGVVGFLPICIVSLYELYLFVTEQQKFSRKIFFSYLAYVVSVLLVFLPWHLEMVRRFGNNFLGMYFGYHVWVRAVSIIEDKGKPFYWYVVVMKVGMRLGFIYLLGALPFCLYKAARKENKFVFLSVWAIFVFILFSLAKSKLVWYITPIYPAVSLMVGHFGERVLNLLMTKVKVLSNTFSKSILMYVFVVVEITYLLANRNMVYTSDLTGSQARLLELKDKTFELRQKVYVDRVELPLVMYYTDGVFEIIDFNPRVGRIPILEYNEQIIILGKRGRFSYNIPQIPMEPKIVGEDGDYILWYYESGYNLDKNELERVTGDLNQLSPLDARYNQLVSRKAELEKKIQYGLQNPISVYPSNQNNSSNQSTD